MQMTAIFLLLTNAWWAILYFMIHRQQLNYEKPHKIVLNVHLTPFIPQIPLSPSRLDPEGRGLPLIVIYQTADMGINEACPAHLYN